MSRRRAREIALQTLFYIEFNPVMPDCALTMVCSTQCEEHFDDFNDYLEIDDATHDYALNIVDGVMASQNKLDELINKYAEGWTIDRMASVDRNIARLAIFEITRTIEPLPPGVVINEAVELAKIFGTDESSKFINGILGAVVKDMDRDLLISANVHPS